MRTSLSITVAIILFATQMNGGRAAQATYEQPVFPSPVYDGVERSSQYVQVRDGTRLAVDIFRPLKAGVVASERLPVVWMNTPYNRRVNGPDHSPTVETYPGYALQLVKFGYVVAVADFRGLYASFGRNMGYNRGEWVPAAWNDAYDLTEWFAKQPWSSGKVGMWGCSATGGSQLQAAATRPPSLKAIMPMSAEFDVYEFRELGGIDFPPPSALSAPAANAARDATAAAVDGEDAKPLLAQAIASHHDNVEDPGTLLFRDSHSEAMGLDWWRVSSPSTYVEALRRDDMGVYLVANWDEAGTKHGSFVTFNNLKPSQVKLTVGPEGHCQWDKAQADTGFSIVNEELQFFDHWLKGKENHVMDRRVTYYTYNAEPGHEWQTADAWPLPNQHLARYFLADGSLDTAKPTIGARDATQARPASPSTVVKIERPVGGLTYRSAVLTHDTQVTGSPVAHLWIASTAPDVAVTVWLDDVAPDGTTRSFQMFGRLLASARKLAPSPYQNAGLPYHSHLQADSQPLVPHQSVRLDFALLPMSYIFKRGHRISALVAFADPRGDGGSAPQVELMRGGKMPSYLELPIIDRQ